MPFLKVIYFAAIVLVFTSLVAAEPVTLKPTNTWMGAHDDETLVKEMPENGVITAAKDFDKLIKAWKLAEKTPEVDFDKELVLVATTRGSRLSLTARLDEKGDLKSLGIATRDLRPGFRYVIISVPKMDVKTVNGKELPR